MTRREGEVIKNIHYVFQIIRWMSEFLRSSQSVHNTSWAWTSASLRQYIQYVCITRKIFWTYWPYCTVCEKKKRHQQWDALKCETSSWTRIHTGLLNTKDKVSRRCGKCPYWRKDWAEFPLHILSDKILLSRKPHGTRRGYIFVMGGLFGSQPPNLWRYQCMVVPTDVRIKPSFFILLFFSPDCPLSYFSVFTVLLSFNTLLFVLSSDILYFLWWCMCLEA